MGRTTRVALGCVILVAALWLTARPAPAGEAPAAAPARMASCTVLPETMDHRITPPESLRVSFMITGDIPADLVRFTATSPSGTFREFTAHGNFTKTIMIADRVLKVDSTAPMHELPRGVDCSLTYVHFVDGSSWSAPEP
jgi:hypothetical protein